jgi:hypothetical protein
VDLVVESRLARFQNERDLTKLSQDEAFEAFAGFCVLSGYYEGEFDPGAFRTGGENDLGIDVFGILVNGELLHDSTEVLTVVENSKQLDVQFIVVQAKTSPRFETKVISDLADNLRHIFGPAELVYPASESVADLRSSIRALYTQISRFAERPPRLRVRYVTTGEQVAEFVETKLRAAERSLAALERFADVDFGCVTRGELIKLDKQATGAVDANFSMVKKFAMPKAPGVEEAYTGLLPATDLVTNVLTDAGGGIRKSLFHENVRDFQGYNTVNGEIRNSLLDEDRRRRFAVLHNGITIVARQMRVVGDEVYIRDFQIVNGCQTCHVLFDLRDQLTPEIQVHVRVVHSQDEDVIGGIVAATNLQTAISEEDLTSREQFHKDLEDYFAAHEPAWRLHYERRSKQYSSRQDVEKTRIVTRPQLTRAYAAMFLGEPSGVGRYQQLLEDRRDDLFKQGQQPIAYYTAAAAYYRVEWLIRNRRIEAKYSPVRYHLLAAIMLRLHGPHAVPRNNKKAAEKACQGILNVLWDAAKAESLVGELLARIKKVVEREELRKIPLGEMVRTQRFADSVREELGFSTSKHGEGL